MKSNGFWGESDIYLQPSVSESLCVAVMEAMAMELPVVATAVGGLPEVVANERSGLLVPVGDVDSLAHAIGKLVADPVLRKTMGLEGAKNRWGGEVLYRKRT